MSNSLIVKNLTVSLGQKKILSEINLTVAAGKIVVLMGLNGSGKSTLAKAISGHPDYQINRGQIIFNQKDFTKQPSWQRSRAGLFGSWQNPLEIAGLNFYQFLLTIFSASCGHNQATLFEQRLQQGLKNLKLKAEFLERDLNVGFSGGEKKKAEILQLYILQPQIAVLDEIDSGLDIDALHLIAKNIKQLAKQGVGFLLITHYARLLSYLKVKEVKVMISGKIVKSGGMALVRQLEKQGYQKISSQSK
ncbi:MAG: Fe-S cluster assembly ATPase SufC [Candidatus Buchananbacteria bacterium]